VIQPQRVDFIAVPTQDRDRAETFSEETLGFGVEFNGDIWDSGVCHGAAFQDTEGNGLLIHHRYAPYRDGRLP
jgi:hypothetical protein